MPSARAIKLVFISTNRIRLNYPESTKGVPPVRKFLLKGVKRVEYNKASKSLLISFDDRVTDADELLHSLKRKCGLVIEEEIYPMDAFGDSNALSEFIFSNMRNMNRQVRVQSKGAADITSLAPSALMLLSAVQLFRRPKMPKWYDMAWWALNMYHWRYVHYRSAKKREEELTVDAEEELI